MVSSDADLRALARAELGLTNASRVPAEVIDDEIQAAKGLLSDEIRQRLNNGETLSFYGDAPTEALTYFVLLRLDGIDERGRAPEGRPETISEMRRADFGDEKKNFWRNRLVRALNRI